MSHAQHPSHATALDRIADTAKTAETAYRRAAAIEIARLEAERVTAFRRARLVRLLEDAAHGDGGADDVMERQLKRLCHEFGWSGEQPGERAVLEKLRPVCSALSGKSADGNAATEIVQRLTAFEAWFQSDRGVPFYTLFDQYVQETPVVDF